MQRVCQRRSRRRVVCWNKHWRQPAPVAKQQRITMAKRPDKQPADKGADKSADKGADKALERTTPERHGSDRHTKSTSRSDSGTDTYHRRRKSVFKGIPVVPGIAIGTVRLKFRQTQVLSDRVLTEDEVPREFERLNEAIRLSKEQLLGDRAKVASEIGEVEAMIFDAHLAILEDPGFLKKVRQQVTKDFKPVEVVVGSTVENYYRTLSMVKDEHIRERAADIRDVGRRLLENLARMHRPDDYQPSVETGNEDDIIFAAELLPSDLVTLERRHCQAVICELGSDRGHAAVMLRAMSVPAVMGVEGLGDNLVDGDTVIVDGSTGQVLVNPKRDVIESFEKTKKEFEAYKTILQSEVDLPAVTTDGHEIQLLANVSKHSEIDLAKLYNVDGVGLYRSEFHLMVGSSFPDEEEQYWIYREAVQKMGGKPVTIRTMDLGSDKKLPYIKMSDEDPIAGDPARQRARQDSFDVPVYHQPGRHPSCQAHGTHCSTRLGIGRPRVRR